MKMKRFGRIAVTLWMLASLSQFSFPGEKTVLTLEESIELALSQNPYHLATEKRVEAAQNRVREAVAYFLPTFEAQGLNTLDEKLFELELPSLIPGDAPRKVPFDFTKDYQFTLQFSVPLYTSGRLMSGLRQAQNNLRSTEEYVRQSQHNTVFNTKRAFYGVLLAREFVKVAEEAVEVATDHFRNVQSLYEVGMASKFDLLRSEVELANLKPQLIKARNSLNVAELSLKTLLGLELSQPIEIKGDLSYQPAAPDLEDCLIKAVQNRPEIGQLKYQKGVAQELGKLARASRFPTLAIAGTYNLWADKFNFSSETWQSFYTINLVLSVPLFGGFSSYAREAQSKAAIKELDLTLKGLEDTIKFEVRQAILNLDEARESLLSQEKNVEQAQESLRIAELNYSEGLATSLDVSSVQALLTQAKTNYSQALYDYVLSIAELDKAMGVGWKD